MTSEVITFINLLTGFVKSDKRYTNKVGCFIPEQQIIDFCPRSAGKIAQDDLMSSFSASNQRQISLINIWTLLQMNRKT